MMVERDLRIDVMRFLGVILIILAHVNPTSFIFELRSFDVPMMVLISAMSFAVSFKQEKYSLYLKKRFNRLVMPVWIFLSAYFLFLSLCSNVELSVMLKSYTLISGIGYVWFVRIILIVSVLSPIVFFWTRLAVKKGLFTQCWLAVFVFSEIIVNVDFLSNSRVISLFIFDWLSYLNIMTLGFAIYLKQSIRSVIFLCVLYFIYLLSQYGFSTQVYKYPPNGIYVIYGILASCSIYYFLNFSSLIGFLGKIKSLIFFISNNSIWIYLFHIPFVKHVNLNQEQWVFNYLLILSMTLSLVYLKNYILSGYFYTHKNNFIYRSLLG